MSRSPATDLALQRLIFAACRQMGLDAEARRDLQVSVTGKASLGDMSATEMKLVVDRLKQCGFKPVSRGGKYRPAPRADLRLVHVLWARLGAAGVLRDPTRAGLNAFVRARFGATWGAVPGDIDMLRDWKQIDAVIQSLLAWCEREGVDLDRERLGR